MAETNPPVYKHVPMIQTDRAPSEEWAPPSDAKGQLCLDATSGKIYQSDKAGNDATWTEVNFAS